LDRDFKGLSAAEKRAFREKYRSLPREKVNERGTIVYLLGKNLSEAADWAFMKRVVSEPPCFSLADCSKKSADAPSPGDEVTLAYPQLVALEVAGSSETVRAAALRSRAPIVARKARKLHSSAIPPP